MYQNLRNVMQNKGITIDAMAALLNVHRNTIANKLDGVSPFDFDQAQLIANVMFPEYRPEYLFKNTEQTRTA